MPVASLEGKKWRPPLVFVGEVVAAAVIGVGEVGAKLKSAANDGGCYNNSTGKMPVGPAARMAVLQRSLREFWWKKPEQFARSTSAIYFQQRYAGLR
jgi:hypothetical protein